jgi:hypothetical protein
MQQTTQPIKQKIFTLWPFIETFADLLQEKSNNKKCNLSKFYELKIALRINVHFILVDV